MPYGSISKITDLMLLSFANVEINSPRLTFIYKKFLISLYSDLFEASTR